MKMKPFRTGNQQKTNVTNCLLKINMASKNAHIISLDECELFESDDHIRIVLVGKTGSGKSATGNTILQKRVFKSKVSLSSLTSECQKETGTFKGQTLAVVDTPGLFDTNKSEEEVIIEMGKCISFSAPGPHVFLVVIQPNRFTKEEQEAVKIIQKLFGEKAADYTMALITHGDDLEADETSVEDLIKGNKDIDVFINQCSGGFHLFNNRNKDPSQVEELLKKIKCMIDKNGGSCYSYEMFEEAERAIKAEMQIILRQEPNIEPVEARRRAEMDNPFIRIIMKYITAGAEIGSRFGEPLGRVTQALTTSVGASLGTLVGTFVVTVRAIHLETRQAGCVLL